MKEIVQKENPALRRKTKEIPVEEIKSKKIQTILKEMREALNDKDYGIALAAPQIGVSLKIFIVKYEGLENIKQNEDINEVTLNATRKNVVYINPKIVKTSKKTDELEEACLSVDGYFGIVTRHRQVTIEAYDENGNKFIRGGSGLLAQIFQHEIDHLNGVLYVDHAKNIQKIETENE